MICQNCGHLNHDDAMFCAGCGSPLAAQPEQQPTESQPAQNAAYAQPYGQQAPYQGAPMQAAPAVEGCLGAAWKDITSTPGWVKRVLLLCLVGCVPILNFAITGYCVRWGRELSFGKRAEMPKTIFRKKEISTGFFALLISLGLGFACGLVFMVGFLLISGLFGSLHPTAGLVVAIILLIAMTIFIAVLLTPLVEASIMRMSVVGYLESGFNVKTVLEAFRKNPGSLIGASLVPRIAVGLVAFIVSLLITLLFGLLAALAGAAASSDPTAFANMLSRNPALAWSMASGGAYLMLLGYLLATIVSTMFNVFAELFAARAVGHWTSRNAPEWASESEEGAPVEDAAGTAL